jgi:nucleoside-diphosphate-sugar epimerase
MKEKLVITGATGFVGSNLTSYFLAKNYEVHLILRSNSDISNLDTNIENLVVFRYDNDLNNLISFFKEVQPMCVFHLASNFIAEHQSSQIDSLVASNITFGLHILEAMKEAGIKKIINTGTSWQHFNNEDYNPVCLYAATKQAFESLIEYYVQAEGFKVITLKLFDTYGETDTRPKLINLLNKFADEQTELNMSPGKQMLNLVHISDVCDAFMVAFNQLMNQQSAIHQSFAIANTENHQLKEVIDIFEKVTNKKIKVVWGGKTYRKREVMELWDKGNKLSTWNPSINLEEGFSRYILK